MRAPSKRVERFIREAAERHESGNEITEWLDIEQRHSAGRGHCYGCDHMIGDHGESEPEVNYYSAACRVADCDCEHYEPRPSRR